MNIDDIVSTTEKYFREFILYLLSFFYPKGSETSAPEIDSSLNKAIVFSVLSAIFGAYIWHIYIDGGIGKLDILRYAVDHGLLWISIGLVTNFSCRILSLKPSLMSSILCVLRVMPVAHIVAIYAAYCALPLFEFAIRGQGNVKAAYIAYIIEIIIIFIYLPQETKLLVPERPGVGKFAGFLTSALVLLIIIVRLTDYGYDQHHKYDLQSQTIIGVGVMESGQ